MKRTQGLNIKHIKSLLRFIFITKAVIISQNKIFLITHVYNNLTSMSLLLLRVIYYTPTGIFVMKGAFTNLFFRSNISLRQAISLGLILITGKDILYCINLLSLKQMKTIKSSFIINIISKGKSNRCRNLSIKAYVKAASIKAYVKAMSFRFTTQAMLGCKTFITQVVLGSINKILKVILNTHPIMQMKIYVSTRLIMYKWLPFIIIFLLSLLMRGSIVYAEGFTNNSSYWHDYAQETSGTPNPTPDIMYQSKPLYEIVEKESCKYQASQNIKKHIEAGMASNARHVHSGINLPTVGGGLYPFKPLGDLPNPLGVEQGLKAIPWFSDLLPPLPDLAPPFPYGHNPDQILADICTIKSTNGKASLAPSIVEHLIQTMPHDIWSSDGKVNKVLENYLHAFMLNITNPTQANYTAFVLLKAGVSTYQHLLYLEDDYTDDELNKIFWKIFMAILKDDEQNNT